MAFDKPHLTNADAAASYPGGIPLGFGVTAALAGPLAKGGRLIDTAIAHGIRVFDTAPSYADGKAESLLAPALQKHSDVRVMTKAGINSTGLGKRERDFSPEAIEQSIDASRQRLQRDVIDLVWLHGPDPDEAKPALFDKLEEIRARGWVRQFGIAGRGAKLLRTMDHDLIEAVMLPVHAGMDVAGKTIWDRVRHTGKFVVAIEVLSPAKDAGKGLSPGGARRMAKKLAGKVESASKVEGMSVDDALRWPLETGAADFIVSSTTLRRRLLHSIDVMNALTFG